MFCMRVEEVVVESINGIVSVVVEDYSLTDLERIQS